MTDYKQLVSDAGKHQERLQILVNRLASLDAAKELTLSGFYVRANQQGAYGGDVISDSIEVATRIKSLLRESIESEIRKVSSELAGMFSEPFPAATVVIEQAEPGNEK